MAGRPRTNSKPKAGSGLDEHGKWTPVFVGQRPPFEPGNEIGFTPGHELSTKWGDRALLKLRPRAAELADQIRDLVPVWHASFGPVVELASMTMAQAEVAFAGLVDAADPQETRWLDERASRWAKLAGQY
jgi:hypothetical protein